MNSINTRRIRRQIGTNAIFLLVILIVSAELYGCTRLSSRPIYPDSWPALASLGPGRACPDVSGTYVAVSDEVAPLVYPAGGHPRDMFMFVTIEAPKAEPLLGRRILPWHLAGEFDMKSDIWSTLTRYSAALGSYSDYYESKDDAGWVKVQELQDGLVEVLAGLHGQDLLNLTIRKGGQPAWGNYKSHIYECEDGGLVVYGAFAPPPVETRIGVAAARCTFFRAVDGSLIMLEDQYYGGTVEFKKWWRWPSIN